MCPLQYSTRHTNFGRACYIGLTASCFTGAGGGSHNNGGALAYHEPGIEASKIVVFVRLLKIGKQVASRCLHDPTDLECPSA